MSSRPATAMDIDMTMPSPNNINMSSLPRGRQPQPQSRKATARSIIIERIQAMKKQETILYLHRTYIQDREKKLPDETVQEYYEMREKICNWTYSIIDHFNLSRDTVAISLNIFDRFLATRNNECDVNFALLTSLTTLYIAIKVHEKKKIRLSTLTQLNRGEFGPRDFERMEMEILMSLSWLVHPPTVLEFACNLLKLLPKSVNSKVRNYIFKLVQYAAELAVCDPFFIDYPPSTVAFAAILNVMEYEVSQDLFPALERDRFLSELYYNLNFHRGQPAVRSARDRLQETLVASGVFNSQPQQASDSSCQSSEKENSISSPQREQHHSGHSNANNNSSSSNDEEPFRTAAPSSNDSVDSRQSIDSKGSHGDTKSQGRSSRRARRDSFDSKGSNCSGSSSRGHGRRFVSPRRVKSLVTPC